MYELLEYETPHDRFYKIRCALREDSDKQGHPLSLIMAFVDMGHGLPRVNSEDC